MPISWTGRRIGSIAALCLATPMFAGPLDPPAGPVASTGKTLTEIEPRIAISAANTPGDANSLFRIAAPGSYYLSGNLGAASGFVTIEIASSHVVLDLNGFTITGAAGAVAAIRCEVGGILGVTIRNGVITAFPGAALDLEVAIVQGCLIERVHAVGNGFRGIRAGNNAIVRDCIAEDNGNFGISVGANATVTGCVSRNNGADGFVAGLGGVFTNCAATGNLGEGFIHAGNGTLLNCVSRGNAGSGFEVSTSSLSGCTAASNSESGFLVSSSTLTGCVAVANQQHGIIASSDCLIQNCVADSNGGSITNGAGIFVTGADTRIDSNNVTDNDIGVRVSGTGNLIVRNSCSGSGTPFNIVEGNRYGAIVNISIGTPAAVDGPAAPSTLATTDPWANFTY